MSQRLFRVAASLLLTAAAVASAASAPAPVLGVLHRLSAAHARPAAWTRTRCGSPSKTPQADIVTSWGAAVTPDSVVEGFGYPRPQMTRDAASTYKSLNGIWEFELAAGFDDPLPIGRTLNQTILVPFPLESCLSGAFAWPLYSKFSFYRTLFDAPFPAAAQGSRTLLHFGAIDWNSTIYLNGVQLAAPHLGGYDGFTLELTTLLRPSSNELIVRVYDPSDEGFQVHGKQRISAIPNPSGDTYTPSSGIWQTSWLESVPGGIFISSLRLRGSTQHLFITVYTGDNVPGLVSGTVALAGANVTSFAGVTGAEIVVPIPNAQLWDPSHPTLYDLTVTATEPSTSSTDTVRSYFALREISLLNYTINGTGTKGVRPAINGDFTFLAGWLDQSWFPDGEYTAPGDDALRFDVQGVKDFGLNMVRLHQKVNPERWYYHADRLGVVVLQDMVQKYGGATNATVEPFLLELRRMIDGRYNHPSIIQWDVFNEGDCVGVFSDVPAVVAWVKAYDPSRLVDTNSGGPANALAVGDVNDIHTYPWPGAPSPSATQYAMVGEFGGIGAFQPGHEWAEGGCFAYLPNPDAKNESETYIAMTQVLLANKRTVSTCVFTQITDVENECDGFYNMDRTNKFTPDEVTAIAAANTELISGSCPQGWLAPLNGFLADGGDVLPPSPAASVAAAKATCEATPGCFGITFMANSSDPGPLSRVYYKNQTSFSESASWWAYINC